MSQIAVIIPCYNEGRTIGKVVSEYRAALPEADIYVYDNNSTDDTAAVARAAGATVRREPRQGKGNVIRTAFTDIEADVYLMTDGDDTYPADNARRMVNAVADEGVDMVIGDRLSATYFTENKRPFHNAGNRLVRWLINRLFHAEVKDIMTGYRAFSRRFVKHFPVLSKGFEIETEMTIHALDKNFLVCEIPVTYRDRPAGSVSKLNTFYDGYRILLTIFSLFRDYRPFLFFSCIAVVCLFVGLAFSTPVFIEYFETGLVPRMPTLVVSCFIILFSMLFFFIGLILDVMTKKHKQLYELLLINETKPTIKQ